MKRLSTLLVVLLFLVAACSNEEPATSVATAGPEAIVEQWLAGISAMDLAALNATTDATNVALVAGAENGFAVEQMEAIVESGLPAATGRSYWSTFGESFTAFLGGDASEIGAVAAEEYVVGDTTFAAVTVRRLDKDSEILARLGADGWKVDMVATAGPALSVQIRRLVAAIVAEGDDAIAFTYTTLAAESLGAALARQQDNRSLELELEAIEDLPIDLSR